MFKNIILDYLIIIIFNYLEIDRSIVIPENVENTIK